MTTKNMLSVLGACIIVIILVAWLRPPQEQNENGRSDYLGDHITEITGETLPRAVREARARGKQRVKVTDPTGNVIVADITQPTCTTFWISDTGETDAIERLRAAAVPVERFHSIVKEGDGSLTFAMNEVDNGEIAGIMYEVSVRVFNIGTTQDWTIDIE